MWEPLRPCHCVAWEPLCCVLSTLTVLSNSRTSTLSWSGSTKQSYVLPSFLGSSGDSDFTLQVLLTPSSTDNPSQPAPDLRKLIFTLPKPSPIVDVPRLLLCIEFRGPGESDLNALLSLALICMISQPSSACCLHHVVSGAGREWPECATFVTINQSARVPNPFSTHQQPNNANNFPLCFVLVGFPLQKKLFKV